MSFLKKIFKGWGASPQTYKDFSSENPAGTHRDFVSLFEGESVDPQYLFILNSPHAGGRLLYNIIDSSSRVCTFINRGGGTVGHSLLAPHPQHPRRGDMKEYLSKMHDLRFVPPFSELYNTFHNFWEGGPVFCDRGAEYIFRAKAFENFFSLFGEVFFIIQIRNPYNCETLDVREWVKDAQMLRWYSKHLSKKLVVRYEDLVMLPASVKKKLVKFLPALSDIDMETSQRIRLVRCNRYYKHSALSKDYLKVKNKKEKNEVLKDHIELLEFFGYKFLE